MEDEEMLEQSIKEYEHQLLQIGAAIRLSDEAEQCDLSKLQFDLKQLIELTKDNLLSIKKKRMLRELDELSSLGSSDAPPNAMLESSHLPTTSGTLASENSFCGAPESAEHDEDLQKLLESLEGTKCQAPFGHEWGQSGHHNALVLSVESSNSIESVQDIRVRVLFCNPLYNAMKPCSHFLEGSCKFSDEECHFSHGHLVSFGDVRQFSDPDYSLLRRDATCLAKFKDGLWYPAIVDSVSENHEITVQYKQYKTVAVVPLEDVLPTDTLENDSSSDDDKDALDSDDSEGSSDFETPDVVWVSTTPTSQMLGGWEKHTRGIGSKLMQKMGYVLGRGLGKDGTGRLEPVEAVLLPQGKSLDRIMELKEIAGNRDPIKVEKRLKQKQRRKEKLISRRYQQPEAASVFNFINKKIGNESVARSNCSQPATNPKKVLKLATVKTLNTQIFTQVSICPSCKFKYPTQIESFQVSEDIRKAEQELNRLKNSLSRNQMSDKLVAGQIKQKISEHENLVKKLRQYETAISGEQNIRKNDKKLTKF